MLLLLLLTMTMMLIMSVVVVVMMMMTMNGLRTAEAATRRIGQRQVLQRAGGAHVTSTVGTSCFFDTRGTRFHSSKLAPRKDLCWWVLLLLLLLL